MFFIMGIALFTSRVVLKTLGVVDFGIYNVIGGEVSMMGVVKSAIYLTIFSVTTGVSHILHI